MVLKLTVQVAGMVAALGACVDDVSTPPDLLLELPDGDCSIGEPDCTYSFGAVPVGETSASAFLLWNHGSQTATVQSLELAGDPAFSLQQGDEGSLLGGDAAPVVVDFEALGVFRVEAELTITSEPPAGQISVRLTGTGLLPEEDFFADGCDFGEVQVGTTATGCLIYISNSTTRGVVVASVDTTAPFSPHLDGVGPLPIEIQPAQIVAFPVDASPTAVGPIEGIITIELSESTLTQAVSVIGT
jgi:hypothetical protein